MKTHLKTRISISGLLTLLCSIFLALPALAFEFNLGRLEGNFDSTLSYGIAWRMEDPDPDIFGNDSTSNGIGNARSQNYDDGNLNYKKGDPINNTVKSPVNWLCNMTTSASLSAVQPFTT